MITGQNSVRLRRVLRPLGGVRVILWKIEFNCCIIKNVKSRIPNHKQKLQYKMTKTIHTLRYLSFNGSRQTLISW
jgi:hypothetical protein